MNAEKYLSRIKVNQFTKPDLDSLIKLHRNHLLNIPFENLDIHANKKIILDSKNLQKKILENKRGGYCYELNGMFYLLLKELGYDVKMLSARVNNNQGGWGPEFDHLFILVKLEETWLADVGFGDSFIEPIKFELNTVQKKGNAFFKIVRHNRRYHKLMKSANGKDFSGEHLFTLKERYWNEFEKMNYYQQTSSKSHFRKGKVCTIATEKGRITLNDFKLTITTGMKKTITEFDNKNKFEKYLMKFFGIDFKK